MERKTTLKRKKALQAKLNAFLTLSAQRGRVVSQAEAIRALNISRQTFNRLIGNMNFAQTWFQVNPDGPLDAKVHYNGMIDEFVNENDKDVYVRMPHGTAHIIKSKASRASEVVAVASKSSGNTTEKAKNVVLPVDKLTVEQKPSTVPATQADVIIQRIREAYVMAPPGDMPNVSKIMKEFGMVDGTPNQVTEDEVRLVMIKEEWKAARTSQLHKTMDMIPDEIKMVTAIRNVEAQKMLFEEMKAVHRNNRQFYSKGQVTSLDGSTVINWTPDPTSVAAIAEVMRRMVDGGGNINILINQFGKGSEGAAAGAMSLVTKQYLSKLTEMNPEQLKIEIDQFEALNRALTGQVDQMSIEDIENQPIEIIAKKAE